MLPIASSARRIPSQRLLALPLAVACLVVCLSGCHVLTPHPIAVTQQHIDPDLICRSEPQIEVGRPNKFLDTVGWVVGIPGKVILWDRRVDNHAVSDQTIGTVAEYLHTNHLPHVKVRANQYAPLEDFQRLRKNEAVAWPYRYTLGLLSVAQGAVLPGRIFGGDHYNPYTQTINLYSDIPAIAVHEGAHAKDFTRRELQGTYALAYQFVPLWHETIANEDALAYVHASGDRGRIVEANRILYPAYGTYVGNSVGYFFPSAGVPIYIAAVGAGHVNGRALNDELDKQLPFQSITYQHHQESTSNAQMVSHSEMLE